MDKATDSSTYKGSGRLGPAILAIVLVTSALATQYYSQEVHFARRHQASLMLAETLYVPPVPVLRSMAIGHPGFIADLLYIKGLSYFTDHLFGDRRFVWMDTYIDTVIALDPGVSTIYRRASQWAKMGQLIDRTAIEKSTRYAELGLEHFPDDWRLYLDIGFNYYFELVPKAESDEERDKWLDKAREYFSTAASLPGTRLDPNFVTALFLENNDTKMALFHAYSSFADASDEERRELLYRIEEFENKETVRALREREEAWKRDYPFVPLHFYDVLGARSGRKVARSWNELDTVYQVHSILDGLGEDAGAPAAATGGDDEG